MKYRALFEDEHYDMAHEVLTGHGLNHIESNGRNLTTYHHIFPDYPAQKAAHDGIKETFKGMGWKHLNVPGGVSQKDHFVHPDISDKYLTLQSHRHGSVTADITQEGDIGGMHGTIKMMGENEVAVNAAGPGCVDGIGIGSKGEPGYPANKKKRGVTLRGILSTRGISDAGLDK